MASNMEQLRNRLGNKAETVKKAITNEEENKELVLQHYDFDFEVEEPTLNYLKEQAHKIHMVASKAYTALGEIFVETQEKLTGSNQHDGLFKEWYTALGYSNGVVYRLISRNNLLTANCGKRNLIESLPLTLSYEIARPTCDQELKDRVLNGEIRTLKEFKEAKNELIEVVEKEPAMANTNIFEVIKTDYNEFRTKVESFEKFIIEDLEKVETGKQEKIAKEIEEINKRIDKLMKSL